VKIKKGERGGGGVRRRLLENESYNKKMRGKEEIGPLSREKTRGGKYRRYFHAI